MHNDNIEYHPRYALCLLDFKALAVTITTAIVNDGDDTDDTRWMTSERHSHPSWPSSQMLA